MKSLEDEEENVPQSVNNYHFIDKEGNPICFSILPLVLGDAESQNSPKKVFLRGDTDDGLQKIYKQIIAWKVLFAAQPEISVLSKDKYWIKLQKPRKSFENIIKAILITIHSLHFLKRNPEASARALRDHLHKVLSSYDAELSKSDISCHQLIIKAFSEADEALGKSKLLHMLLEGTRKRTLSDQDILTAYSKKFKFIVDDDDDHEDDDDDDDDDDVDEDVGDKVEEEFFDIMCAICDNGGEIWCCEGECKRSFHPTAVKGNEGSEEGKCHGLGLTEAEREELEMEKFLCPNCLHKQHQCFACGKLGSSDKEAKPEVFQCVSANCGYFYHPECVSDLLHPGHVTEIEKLKKEITSGESFTCPIHNCYVCKQGENKNVRELEFAICRRCPMAYHRKCLPRDIAFEASPDGLRTRRAWDDLIPNRIIIYCLKHTIEKSLCTPAQDHIIFPRLSLKKKTVVSSSTGGLTKERRKAPSKDSMKLISSIKTSKAIKNVSSVVKRQKSLIQENSSKGKASGSFKEIVKGGTAKPFLSKASSSISRPLKKMGFTTLKLSEGSALVKSRVNDHLNCGSLNKSPLNTVKKKSSVLSPVADGPLKEKILKIMKKSSSMTLDDISDGHNIVSAQYQSRNVAKTITQEMVERYVEAIRTALKKLDGGATIEDAKAICEIQILNHVMNWKSKLQIYLMPFLVGARYTSLGRHFTKVDKLKEIVEKLHFYVQKGDMIVDFCCGANDFSRLMKEKIEEMGMICFYKNYDVIQPENDFCFEKKDWMTVKKDELPTGSQLIMGLNPPFGVAGALANKFINKALEFKPKLLILIVPQETERLDKKVVPYDLIWEDDSTLAGKSFYLPGSVDVYDKPMDQWNERPPPLRLWSRPDWTAKHRVIAEQWGHISKVKDDHWNSMATDLPVQICNQGEHAQQSDHDELGNIQMTHHVAQEGFGSVASSSDHRYRIGGGSFEQSADVVSHNIDTLCRMSYTEIEERQKREHGIRMQLQMDGQQNIDDLSQWKQDNLDLDGHLLPFCQANMQADFPELGSSGPQNYPMQPTENYLRQPDSIMREQVPHSSSNRIFNNDDARSHELNFVPGPVDPFSRHQGSGGWITD
ncbi:hypothetical protein H6P81_006069 [Aristolochia fimbriata]|uniref:Zinc finger PHD-type domain-containing protein n=1 Tax=Aristolochia fimbriata TaxID=158543 RepID=A0AAV7EWA3_ARIFI|nr:hypothetical protein H6P81_006069 [Aristolochia fimbriata]